MRLSFVVGLAAICQVAYCQTRLNSTALFAIFAEFPTCAVSFIFSESRTMSDLIWQSDCAATELLATGCPTDSWQDCLCNNYTIQIQVSTCTRTNCSFDDSISMYILLCSFSLHLNLLTKLRGIISEQWGSLSYISCGKPIFLLGFSFRR